MGPAGQRLGVVLEHLVQRGGQLCAHALGKAAHGQAALALEPLQACFNSGQIGRVALHGSSAGLDQRILQLPHAKTVQTEGLVLEGVGVVDVQVHAEPGGEEGLGWRL